MKKLYEALMKLVGKQKRYWIISFKAMDSSGEYQDIETYSKYLNEFLCNQCVVSIRTDLRGNNVDLKVDNLIRRFYKKIEKVVETGYTIEVTGYKLIQPSWDEETIKNLEKQQQEENL